MTTPDEQGSGEIQDLARRLLAIEAAREAPSGGRVHDAARVCEKLRVTLSKLVGPVGFRALLSRALALSKAEVPALGAVRVGEDGTLEGFDEAGRGEGEGEGEGKGEGPGAAGDGGAVLVGRLLGLLVTFIGRALTLRLVRDAWSDAPGGGTRSGGEEWP